MRILVASDSHGDAYALKSAVLQQPNAKVMYFLGDGEYDLEYAKSANRNMPIIAVRGNCDYGSSLPINLVDEIGGKRIYITHGFAEQVKSTTSYLYDKARAEKASIALYGHTHNPDTTYDNGIWLVNPGSIRQDSYAVIDITDKGIMPILMKLR